MRKCAFESLSTVILNRLELLVQQNIEGASEMYNKALSIPLLTQQFSEHSYIYYFDLSTMATISDELEIQLENTMLETFSEDCLKQRAEFFVLKFETVSKKFKSVERNKASQLVDFMSIVCKNMVQLAKTFKSALKKKCGTDGACTLNFVSRYNLLQFSNFENLFLLFSD